MKKLLILICIFIAGFLTHALLLPDLFSDPFTLSKTSNFINKSNQISQEELNNGGNTSQTTVIFKNGTFSPRKVWITKGNHLYIVNTDKENKMSLEASNSIFNTIRPYGLSEVLDVVPDKLGQFSVIEKNSNTKLEVVVK
jgi:hypothetical protein